MAEKLTIQDSEVFTERMNTNSNPDSSQVPSVPITRPGQIRETLLAGVISTGLVIQVIREGLRATTHVVRNG